jgi:hypothetical protein
MWKKVTIKPETAAVLTKKQWYKITASEEGDRFPCCHSGFHLAKELLVVTGRDEIPVMITYIFVANRDISYFEKKELIKKILKDKLKMQSSTIKEKIFRLYFLSAGLYKLGIKDKEELMEKFPRTREYVVLLNDSNSDIVLDIHQEMLSPKILSLN